MMNRATRRRKGGYFSRAESAPPPVTVRVRRRVSFSETDPMGILWHGRYASYFEQANEALGRRCGISYPDFMQAGLQAPIVQFHIDYFASPTLGEEITVIASLIWNEGARLNIEYEMHKPDSTLAATGYTVQMLISNHREPILVSPPLLENCRRRWRNGEFNSLSNQSSSE